MNIKENGDEGHRASRTDGCEGSKDSLSIKTKQSFFFEKKPVRRFACGNFNEGDDIDLVTAGNVFHKGAKRFWARTICQPNENFEGLVRRKNPPILSVPEKGTPVI